MVAVEIAGRAVVARKNNQATESSSTCINKHIQPIKSNRCISKCGSTNDQCQNLDPRIRNIFPGDHSVLSGPRQISRYLFSDMTSMALKIDLRSINEKVHKVRL
jgi:hypothetical protein